MFSETMRGFILQYLNGFYFNNLPVNSLFKKMIKDKYFQLFYEQTDFFFLHKFDRVSIIGTMDIICRYKLLIKGVTQEY